MAKPNTGNWDDVQPITGGGGVERLDLGGHYLQILKAEYISGNAKSTGKPYQMLKLYFDTAKIDQQAGFFGRKYQRNIDYNGQAAKWPNAGTGIVSVPFPEETDQRTIGRWKGFIEMVNESNGPDWNWDTDTDTIKGKHIGGVFRDEEYEYNGEVRNSQKLAWFCSVNAVKDATIPEPRTLPESKRSEPAKNDLDLPFDL